MVFVYNSIRGANECRTREEAIKWINGLNDNKIEEMKPRNTTKYPEYKHTYEAMILYIVHSINDVVNDADRNFANYQVIAQVFTASLMKYYINEGKSYSGEKPILASMDYHLKNPVCFEAYKEYFKQVERLLKQKLFETTLKNGDVITPTVYWTEIPASDLEYLVDDREMVHIINNFVLLLATKNGYHNLQKLLRKLYKKLPMQWKRKRDKNVQ